MKYSFPYVMMNSVMRVVKDMSPRIVSQKYDNLCEMKFSIARSKAKAFRERLRKLSFE